MEMNENKKIVVYVDLDDTLVNFMSGVKKCPKETVARFERDEKVRINTTTFLACLL